MSTLAISQPRHTRSKKIMALVLTFSAGWIDIVGYLAIYHRFAANMTGNTIHLGQELSRYKLPEMAVTGAVILAFLVGSVAGRSLIEWGARRRLRSIASVTLVIEAALVLLVASPAFASVQAGNPLQAWLPLAVLAVAMGLQAATLTRIGPLTIHTVFVTGMLNKLGQLLARAAVGWHDLRQGAASPGAASRQRQTLHEALFFFGIWLLYMAGAIFGDWMGAAIGLRALAVPAALLCVAIAVDQYYPLSIEEELDEERRDP